MIAFLNSTPISWISKRQKTVETSTYGSEMVAARIATEKMMELRFNLRALGVPIEGPVMMYGDNQSVILSTTLPSSILKKKHLSCNYFRIREAIAARIIRFEYVCSARNFSDIMTKPLDRTAFKRLTQPLLFRTNPSQRPDDDPVLQVLEEDPVDEELIKTNVPKILSPFPATKRGETTTASTEAVPKIPVATE